MITLALSQLVYFFANQAPFTGGEDGIQGVPRGELLGIVPLNNDMYMYWFVAGIFLLVFFALYRIIHSPFGQVLKAIRENEPRAISLGYKAERYQVIAFTLSSTIAGIAGGTKAIALGFATLTDVHFMMSGEVILMTLVGGMGTLFGPVVGAVAVTLTELYFASFGSWVMFILGAMFVSCVLMFRRGLVGEIAHRLGARL
jgi:branched-chain amino acid transport system permease protein